MAINNVGGFSEGFARGFGLVNTVQQQKRQDEQFQQRMALQQKQQEDLAEYRRGSLEADRAQIEATKDYRNVVAANQERDDEIRNLQARAGLLRAERELLQTQQDSVIDPQEQAAIDASQSLTRQRETQTDIDEFAFAQKKEALNLNDIYLMATQPEKFEPAQIDQFNELVAKSAAGSTRFNVANLTSNAMAEASQVFPRILENIAQGNIAELNRKELDAMGRVIGLDTAKYTGRRIDPKMFVNLPPKMTESNLEILSVGLQNVETYKDPKDEQFKLKGRLHVVTRNQETGELIPYFPPLTDYRNPSTNEPLNLTLDEATQAAASFSYMRNQLTADPIFTERVRDALIQQKYGTEGEFQKELRNQEKQLTDLMTAGASKDNRFGYVQEGETLQEMMSPEKIDILRGRIEDQLLRNQQPKSSGMDVDAWLRTESESLANFELSKGKTQRGGGGVAATTVGDLLPELFDGVRTPMNPEGYDPNMVSNLSAYFTKGKLNVPLSEFIDVVKELAKATP